MFLLACSTRSLVRSNNYPFRYWRTAFSWTCWLSHILLQLLTTLSIVFLDGQLLIPRQLRCHVNVSEFFKPVEFNRAKKPTLKATLERSLNLRLQTFTFLVFQTKQGV